MSIKQVFAPRTLDLPEHGGHGRLAGSVRVGRPDPEVVILLTGYLSHLENETSVYA